MNIEGHAFSKKNGRNRHQVQKSATDYYAKHRHILTGHNHQYVHDLLHRSHDQSYPDDLEIRSGDSNERL